MTSFTIDTREMKELEKDLRTFAKRSVPHAVQRYLNGALFRARSEWQSTIKSDFVNRNKFTVKSVLFEKAKFSRNIGTMQSVTGTIAPYLLDQEEGATLTGGGKHGKPIPTATAAGQGVGTVPRTKTVTRPNKMASIRLTSRGKGKGSRAQRIVIALKQAKDAGNSYVFLEMSNGTKGIFKVPVGDRGKLRMVWSLSHGSVTIEPTHMLENVLKRIQPSLDEEFVKAVRDQLRRNRVFGF